MSADKCFCTRVTQPISRSTHTKSTLSHPHLHSSVWTPACDISREIACDIACDIASDTACDIGRDITCDATSEIARDISCEPLMQVLILVPCHCDNVSL